MMKGQSNSDVQPLKGPRDIKLEVEKLYKLPHFGKQLEKDKMMVVINQRKTRREVTFQPPTSAACKNSDNKKQTLSWFRF